MRMVLAATSSLFFTLLTGRFLIARLYGLKVGKSIRVRDCPVLGPRHKKKSETPTMGGLLFILGTLFSAALWMEWTSPFTWALALSLAVGGSIGALDDYRKIKRQNSRGIPGKVKMAGLILLSFAVLSMIHFGLPNYSWLYFVPFCKEAFAAPAAVVLLLTPIVVAGSANAVNLTDGLDGLATGCVVFASGVFALIAFLSNHLELSRYLGLIYIEGSGQVAIFLAALFGSCLAFLWFNNYPAQVFMGDTGSLALGAVLGVAAVLLRREFLLALVGGVFVVEALSVIIQVTYFRASGGKRVFLCAPLHHHYEHKGMPERRVVMRFWIVGFVLALLGVASILV